MPRCQTWIISLLAPVSAFLLLISTFNYVTASKTNADRSAPVNTTFSATLHGPPAQQNSSTSGAYVQATTLVTTPYDASIAYSVFPAEGEHVFPNGQIVYTMRITHNNDITVSGLLLTSRVSTEFIPEEVFTVGATVVELTSYPTYTWQIDNLPPAGQAVIYIVGHADAHLSDVGSVINVATLVNEYETAPDDNDITISLPITLPSITLSSYASNVNESNTQAAVDIELDFPNPHGYSYVDYATVDGGSSTSGEDYVPISGTLTISQARTSERFFVDIFEDAIDEDSETVQVQLSNPRGIRLGSSDLLTITIVDNDGAGILVDPLTLELPESGASLAYSMSLTSQPPEEVIINIAPPDNNVILDKQLITFTAANWNSPQTVTVSSIDNRVDEGNRALIIEHQVSSPDPIYHSKTASDVSVDIIDDDNAAIIVSSTSVTTSEESYSSLIDNSTYSIVLDSEPTAPVSITMATDSQLLLKTDAITFTPLTWNLPQTITVAANDDNVAEGTHQSSVNHIIESEDAKYVDAEIADIIATILDNDEAGLAISKSAITVTEAAASQQYTITLTSEPLQPVEVTLTSSDDRIEVSPVALQFLAEEWQTPQRVSVFAPSDGELGDSQLLEIEHRTQSNDAAYNSLIEQIPAILQNSDTASLRTSTDSLSIEEGRASSSQPSDVETDQYSVLLTSRPANTVTVTIKHGEGIIVTPNSFTFSPEQWPKPQQIVVSVENDATFRGHQRFTLTHQLTSRDSNYNAQSHVMTVRVSDDDSPVDVTVKKNSLVEGTSSESATIALVKQPTSTVTITLTTNDQISVDPPLMTFTGDNWNIPQSITLLPANDNTLESEQQAIVSFDMKSDDENYNSAQPAELLKLPIDDIEENPNKLVFLPMMNR